MLHGAENIKQFLSNIPQSPGVYRMINSIGEILYVGKAKNLKVRVSYYTKPAQLSNRIKNMVSAVEKVEIIVTKTESEALLLEASLIKSLRPRYNILLRDDKTFPYILIKEDHPFPQITKYRGKRDLTGKYFGPFASVQDVNNTLQLLQKTFLLRSCSDTVFKGRKRPCVLYEIKRCSAPCTNKISQEEYSNLIRQSKDFLQGKSAQVVKELENEMTDASHNMEYELAAIYRDRIKAINNVQQFRHNIIDIGIDDADVIAAYKDGEIICVQVFFIRGGQNFGNKTYFPAHTDVDTIEAEVLDAFIGQI
jgi:excinuclease ABC subunit C